MFKVVDKVKVVKRVDYYSTFFLWVDNMNSYIGNVYTINDIITWEGVEYYKLEHKECRYIFCEESLESERCLKLKKILCSE